MVGRRQWIAGLGAAAFVPRLARAQSPRPLVARYPALGSLPWLDLGGRPTALTNHPTLARDLGLGALWIKRDDAAGSVYGGSKARKLELLLGQARRQGHHGVLTFGGVGSNHALATAVATRGLGMRCHLVLLHEPPSAHARAHLLGAVAQGAVLHAGRRDDRDDPDLAARIAPRESLYRIPMGGTSPLGNIGYVDAAFELAAQLREPPDAIYVAVGTTGTAAGIYVGMRAAGLPCRLIGVRASGRGTGSLARIGEQVRLTVAALRAIAPSFPAVTLREELFALDHRAVGAGYARPTAAGTAAERRCASRGGPRLDPTYTAKAFSALVRRAGAHRGSRIVFWNTFDPRPIAFDHVSPRDLPAGLRGYARE